MRKLLGKVPFETHYPISEDVGKITSVTGVIIKKAIVV